MIMKKHAGDKSSNQEVHGGVRFKTNRVQFMLEMANDESAAPNLTPLGPSNGKDKKWKCNNKKSK